MPFVRSNVSCIADLGRGIAFASQMVPNADELTYLYIGQIDEALRARIQPTATGR